VKNKAKKVEERVETVDFQRDSVSSIPGQGKGWKQFFSQWALPLIGVFLFIILLIGSKTRSIEHPWTIGDLYADSSKRIQDPVLKKKVLEEGGDILRKQLAVHPYHARVWVMYGHYFIQKEDWDSCIYAEKKALELGSGTVINSIEEMAKQFLNYALNKKLEPVFKQKEVALKIIEDAVVPGSTNIVLIKYRGLVYVNSGDFENGKTTLLKYLTLKPRDPDALYAMSLNYLNQGMKAEGNEYFIKTQQVDPNNPRNQVLINKLNQ